MNVRHFIILPFVIGTTACASQMPQSALPKEASATSTTITMPAMYAMATPQAAPVTDLSKSANPCARNVDDAITQLEKLMAAKGAKPYKSAAAY